MSAPTSLGDWDEDLVLCVCGHVCYLHDDGEDACLDCECQHFKAAA